MGVMPVVGRPQGQGCLGRNCRRVLLLVCFAVCCAACGRKATPIIRIPTPTLAIRHRDAGALMLAAGDLGPGYRAVEKYRLEHGMGWGEDTTRLSGYRTVFVGSQGTFSRVDCQVECYLSVTDTQAAFRSLREQLDADLRSAAANRGVTDGEERLLGDWNRMFTVRSSDDLAIHYIFMRENVLVTLALTGPDSPDLPDLAARQARLLDERIFR